MELTAATDSGNLQVVFAGPGQPNVDSNNKFFGDGTSTTADISVINNATLNLKQSFNSDYDYTGGTEPTRIDTFNIKGQVGKESITILRHYNTSTTHIKQGQTWNISDGTWTPETYFAGKGQHGTVNLANGRMNQPGTAFLAGTDTLSLNLSGLSNLNLGDTNLGFLEALDGQPGNGSFSYSGTPVVSLANAKTYSFDYSGTTSYPILAGLLQNADIAVSGQQGITINADLRIGHGKYFMWRWDNNFTISAYKGITTTAGAKLAPAGNAPDGVTEVLGIAPNESFLGTNRIDVEVAAPGATVRVGSDDPIRIPSFQGGTLQGTAHAGGVEFYQAITAAKLELRSGTTKMMVNQSLPVIDIGAGTQLYPNSGTTTTVSGTLSGSGDIASGGTVAIDSTGTLAPGTSAGTLGDGSGTLSLAAGATYSLEVADPSAAAGTGYDTVNVNTLVSDGALTIKLAAIGGLTPAQSSLTDVYVVATAASYTGDFTLVGDGGTVTVTGTGWDTSGATLTLNGNDLELSGVKLTGAAAPFDTWATSGTVTGVTFAGDANGDGVKDGLAFLLGAATPDDDATGLLPSASEDSGGLVMTFTMLDSTSRGGASLIVEHSGDLGLTDAWAPVAPEPLATVPDTTGAAGGVNFAVSGSGTLNVVATVPAPGNVIGGKLFGRLVAQE
jgi:hypothetical protein